MSRILAGIVAAALLAPLAARAQATATLAAPATTAAPAPAAPAAPAVKFGGVVDAYYGVNVDHAQTVTNGIRAFDAAPSFQLAYAKLTAAMDPSPAGFRIDLGFAPTSLGVTNLFVQQAYASMKLGPVILDFGRFVTAAGSEVIEAKDNWAYSRSILFTWAIPFAHLGARATVPFFLDGLNLQAAVLDGWDTDTTTAAFASGSAGSPASPHKTGQVSLQYGKDATTASVNFYAGKQPGATDTRSLVDVVLQQGIGDLTINLNGDWAKEGDAKWYGFAGMLRYSFAGDKFRLSARGEWFDDKNGVRITGPTINPTALAATYTEGTLTASIPVGANTELRAEFRYDKASKKVFSGDTDAFSTFEVAALAWF